MGGSGGHGTWDGKGYANSAEHHRALDAWFLERHPPRPSDVVVDLGCGSGEFTARLAALVPQGRVIGVDPDPSMLAAARGHEARNLSFVQAPAEALDDVIAPDSVDLVVSRAMLHWLRPSAYPRVFAAVFRVLRPGGWYHSESAGAGNVHAIVARTDALADRLGLPRPTPFPDAGVVFDQLEAAGFLIPTDGVRTVAQRRAMDRAALIGMLRSQVAVVLIREADPDRSSEVAEAMAAEADTVRRSDGSWDQTFVRLDLLVRKPG
ncbi:MAG TPA: class I SAM-dependent methyltransferase [Candidatus Limnocylindrales bacterium]|nr:class I SAM-dependent methyltransferase [Candidatus Limnocylindrales bacterium]